MRVRWAALPISNYISSERILGSGFLYTFHCNGENYVVLGPVAIDRETGPVDRSRPF